MFLDNNTGGVRAMVGGRDVKQSRFNRAMQARRQVGSLFKPFVYAAAFEAGLSPTAMIDDGPLRAGEIDRAPRRWHLRNADGTYGGMRPVSYGLVKSRNTMSVRVGNIAGSGTGARHGGPNRHRHRHPALPGGISGFFRKHPARYGFGLHGIPEPRNPPADPCHFRNPGPLRAAGLYHRHGGLPGPVARAAATTSRILAQVMQPGGTASSAAAHGVDFPAGGKTGTTDNYRDAWFVGYTGILTGGVWVGFDQMDQGLSQGYGAKLALPIWAKVMVAARKSGYQFGPLP